MRTLIIFSDYDCFRFFNANGDLSHFQEESATNNTDLFETIYDQEGDLKVEEVTFVEAKKLMKQDGYEVIVSYA